MKIQNYILLSIFSVMALLSCACHKEIADGNGPESVLPEYPSDATVETYSYAPSVLPSIHYDVLVNGTRQLVYGTDEPQIAVFGCKGQVMVEIDCLSDKINEVAVRPLSKHPQYEVKDGKIFLLMDTFDRWVVEVNGNEKKPLFLFANPLQEEMKDSCKAGNVLCFEAGKIYEAGKIDLQDNQTLFIEGGAVVKGHIYCKDKKNVTVNGGGILDCFPVENQTAVHFYGTENISLNNIIVLNKTKWATQLCHSSKIQATNWKAISTWNPFNKNGSENDSFDVFGSNTMTVKHGFSYAHDDTYCIKSQKFSYCAPVYDISYEDCIAWNVDCGNSFQIGYELGQNVTNISYKNIYSIHSSGNPKPLMRGAISMHNAAGGILDGVTYENVYIENPKEFAIYFNILKSAYSIGTAPDGTPIYWTHPGKIRNITVRNMHILSDAPNGSVIKGFSNEAPIENLVFENLTVNGKKITASDQFNLELKYAQVTFR